MMAKWMAEIDQRTRLAGANKMELLMFHLGTEEIYGINVFKIREVTKVPPVVKIPDSDPRILGLVNLRGENIALVDLKHAIGLGPLNPVGAKLIIAEYNDNKQGFLVAGVDRIIRMSWERIQIPPQMVQSSRQGAVTAVTKLEDGRMVLILDVEKVLAELHPRSEEEILIGIEMVKELAGKRVLVADDSIVARKQIIKTLERLGMKYEETQTGKEALTRLRHYADLGDKTERTISDFLVGVITDIEMPEMDGFSLTRHIREDPRLQGLPVLMHSSLSGQCNVEKGKILGVTDYVTKFRPTELRDKLIQHLGQTHAEPVPK
ncbi:MAG: chemotaxis protein [Nitrospirota bacterium]|jgi:two-component system chemotaxis response regulator CheV|nr:chemotaxis protein [Nitrospirota bacterium]MDH5576438.1 chemotaxis protein [Nitrospirota bacterium]